MTNDTKKSKILNRINPNVCGLDIGASSIFACIEPEGKSREIREYSTFTADLQSLAQWLQENKIESVAMESTGVYWIPVYDILAQYKLHPLLVNAYHLKGVPGRKKTDVLDCEWIYQLHSYGLLNGSFIPDVETLHLRTYVRQRSKLTELSSTQINLMHKALTQMNVQLHQAISDVTGVTGMLIIRAIVGGERNPLNLAKFRNYRCHQPEEVIAKALEGNYKENLIFQLKQSLEIYDFLQLKVIECEAEIAKVLSSGEQTKTNASLTNESTKKSKKKKNKSSYSIDIKQDLINKIGVDLTEIPGMCENTVVKIMSEIGTDMSKWESVKHFASWLGLCPNNQISGGKILSSRTLPSSNRAAQAFRLAANALHSSKSAIGAFFRKKRIGLGTPKAITATAHKLAVTVYNMIKNQESFKDIGQGAYEQKYQDRKLGAARKMAKDMGYELVPIKA